MTKQLNKWLRKFHRWIAIPTALLIPIAAVIKLIGSPDLLAAWAKLEKIPSILMLIMAITGAYLYLAPYIAKGQRKKRITSTERTDVKENSLSIETSGEKG
jgi:hypothetical protein